MLHVVVRGQIRPAPDQNDIDLLAPPLVMEEVVVPLPDSEGVNGPFRSDQEDTRSEGKGKRPRGSSMTLASGENTSEWNLHLMGKQCHHMRFSPTPVQFSIPDRCFLFFDEYISKVVVASETDVRLYSVPFSSVVTERNRFLGGPESRLLGMKFSLDLQHVMLQYANSKNKVDIVAVDGRSRVTQACKKPRSHYILGFYWTRSGNFILITTNGVELYKHSPNERRALRHLKSFSHAVNWFCYSVSMRILLLSVGGAKQNELQAYYFSDDSVVRLPKFVLEVTSLHVLTATEVAICQIYGRLYVQFIQPLGEGHSLTLFRLTKENVVRERVIDLSFMPGLIKTHVVDNLLVVHNLPQKIAMMFDIMDKDPESGVAPALPIAPIISEDGEALLYEDTWEFLYPCHVIDCFTGLRASAGDGSRSDGGGRVGHLWSVQPNLAEISLAYSKRVPLISFLLRRASSKILLLNILRSLIEDRETLLTLSKCFDKINSVLYIALHQKMMVLSQAGYPGSPNGMKNIRHVLAGSERNTSTIPKSANDTVYLKSDDGCTYVVVDQADMYTYIFSELEDDAKLEHRHFIAVLTEYIRSLNYHHIPVEHFLHELVINILVRNKRWYQLAQFLQYHVVSDSVHVACQLLSLERTYPPAYQLALDMLKRLSSPDQIVEVLLARKQVLAALRYLRSSEIEFPVTRFLEVAYDEDPTLYYTVFKFFERRGEIRQGDPSVKKYYRRFIELFAEGRYRKVKEMAL